MILCFIYSLPQIPKVQKHKPVPKTLYTAPPDQALIAKRKEENRQQAEVSLMICSFFFS